MRAVRCLALVAGLAFLTGPTARGQVSYKIQPIVKQGDTIDGVPITSPLHVGMLNDKGQLVFRSGNEALFAYTDGRFTPLVVGGREAPGGKWNSAPNADRLSSLNERGNIASFAFVTVGGQTTSAPFFWDAPTQKLTFVALAGMPAANNLTFLSGLNFTTNAAINAQDEIAFGGVVADAAGKARVASFFLGRDKTMRSVVLPDQELPGGGTLLQNGGFVTVTDAGVVAFRARRSGDPGLAFSAYQWENGVLTPLARVGGDAPGGGKITLEDGTRALYRLDPDGNLTLLLKQGTVIELGEITQLIGGGGIGFNGKGQIALPLRIAGGLQTLVLLTPTTP